MKRSLVVLFLLLANTCMAQIGYGPEAGIGMSTFKFQPPSYPVIYTSSSVTPMLSGRIGIIVDLPITKRAYFHAGVSFSRKGAERAFSYHYSDSFNEAVSQKLSINYFEVPLILLYKTGMQGKGRFVAGIGATPSLIAGGRDKYADAGTTDGVPFSYAGEEKINVGKTLKSFDIGVTLTAGYELPTGLYCRVYYTGGVSDIGVQTEVVKNRVLAIAIGYVLGNGRNINKETDDLIDRTQ